MEMLLAMLMKMAMFTALKKKKSVQMARAEKLFMIKTAKPSATLMKMVRL